MIEDCLKCGHSLTTHTGDGVEEWSTACALEGCDCACRFYWDSEDEEWAKEH